MTIWWGGDFDLQVFLLRDLEYPKFYALGIVGGVDITGHEGCSTFTRRTTALCSMSMKLSFARR